MPLLVLQFVNSNYIFIFSVSLEKSVFNHKNLSGSMNSHVNEGHNTAMLCFQITLFISRSLLILSFSLREHKNLVETKKKIFAINSHSTIISA